MTPEEILILCGQIAAVLAIAFLFYDVIVSIVKKRNTKLSIVALVFLSAAAVLFVVAQFILKTGIIATILTILAIALLAAYLICDVIIVLGNMKRNKKELEESQTESAPDAQTDAETERQDDGSGEEK